MVHIAFSMHLWWTDSMDCFFQSQYSQVFHLCTAWVKHSSGDSSSFSFILWLFFWPSQVEIMNIHELPWHINQMNYAARFTELNPHVQANNFQWHPVRVFCHHRGWRLCHNLTRQWHWPMGHGWRAFFKNLCLKWQHDNMIYFTFTICTKITH